MNDGKLHVKSGRDVKRLLQRQQNVRTNAQIPELKDAGKRLEKLEKELAAMKKKLAGHEATIQKLWAWKMAQERRGK